MASSGSLADRLSGPTPGGRVGRAKTNASLRSKPYGSSPRSFNNGKDDSRGDIEAKWVHDKFASHNGIEGGELGARLSGGVGRQITSGSGASGEGSTSRLVNRAFAGVLGKPELKRGGSEGSGLSIKGASTNSGTSVEVEGLAPGTTAEDVAEIFSQCGSISEYRILSAPTAASVRVFLQFETPQGAQTAVSQFDKQTADGRVLKVFVVSAGSLGSRLGVEARKKPPKANVDLLADSPSSTGGMRSDVLVKTDPRAKVITDPSGTNKLLKAPHEQSSFSHRGNRGNSRARGGRGRPGAPRNLSERMDVD